MEDSYANREARWKFILTKINSGFKDTVGSNYV